MNVPKRTQSHTSVQLPTDFEATIKALLKTPPPPAVIRPPEKQKPKKKPAKKAKPSLRSVESQAKMLRS